MSSPTTVDKPVNLFPEYTSTRPCCCECGAQFDLTYSPWKDAWYCRDIEQCEIDARVDEEALVEMYDDAAA